MTNGGWFGILPTLSAAANAVAVSAKNEFEEIRKKCLTAGLRCVNLKKLMRITNGS